MTNFSIYTSANNKNKDDRDYHASIMWIVDAFQCHDTDEQLHNSPSSNKA